MCFPLFLISPSSSSRCEVNVATLLLLLVSLSIDECQSWLRRGRGKETQIPSRKNLLRACIEKNIFLQGRSIRYRSLASLVTRCTYAVELEFSRSRAARFLLTDEHEKLKTTRKHLSACLGYSSFLLRASHTHNKQLEV